MVEITIPIVGIAVCVWAICRVVAARWRFDATRYEIARQLATPTDPPPDDGDKENSELVELLEALDCDPVARLMISILRCSKPPNLPVTAHRLGGGIRKPPGG